MNGHNSPTLVHQKKVARGLKGFIVALIALIGILKVSVGGVINVPIALLFGDLFILFFSLQIIFSFYLMLFPLPKKKRRTTAIVLSIVGLLIVASTLYAGTLRDFGSDSTTFSANLDAMLVKARANFGFDAAQQSYLYGYGGLIGEGLLYLLAPLGKILIIILGVLVIIILTATLFWPLLVKLYYVIKEEMRDRQKRKQVLAEAALLGNEEEKEKPTQVTLEGVLEDEPLPRANSILYRVGEGKVEKVMPKPAPVPEVVQEIKKATPSDFPEDPFVLPTLDNEEPIHAVHQPSSLSQFEKVDDDYDSLQKAVDTSGTFETLTFEGGQVEDEYEALNDEVSPAIYPEDKKVVEAQFNAPVTEETNINEEEKDIIPPNFDIEEKVEVKVEEKVEIKSDPEPEVKPAPATAPTPTYTKVVEEKVEEPVKKKVHRYNNFKLPSINLLDDAVDSGKAEENKINAADFEQRINAFFMDFNIGARVANWTIGSTFTRYEIQLEPTESVKSIMGQMNDISLRLNGASVRFEPIIPGKATSGLEVANAHRTIVNFKECMVKIASEKRKKYLIPLGKDVAGNVIMAPFGDFPHLLVAGSTGSGKSVFIHTVLTSLIMMHNPNELRLLLIDPKRVELAQYSNIPHLLTPIVKEPKEAKIALDRLIEEMERRYKLFEETGVSKHSDYNEIMEETGGETIPLLIGIVDEFADVSESEKEISGLVLRLVQKSRAAGIHLLIATQRPSVQVITGNIKANIPSRVAFMTASATDSMTILGEGGAETLLGYGDMLVDSITTNHRGFLRIQAPFIPVKEVLRITNYLRTNYETHFYDEFLDLKEKVNAFGGPGPVNDDLYPIVLEFVQTVETISISRLQQQFGLGWPRARGLYDMLMQNGVIEPPDEANSAKGAVVIANKRR